MAVKSDVEIISECGDSGEKWAKAFKRVYPNVDEDIMRAWFANAIEAAWSKRMAHLAEVRVPCLLPNQMLVDDVKPSHRDLRSDTSDQPG